MNTERPPLSSNGVDKFSLEVYNYMQMFTC